MRIRDTRDWPVIEETSGHYRVDLGGGAISYIPKEHAEVVEEGRAAEKVAALRVMEGLEDALCMRDGCGNRTFSCDVKDAIKAYRERT